MSIQQLMLGVGASKKTYVDDVFSNYVYTGTGSSHAINNGIDLSGKGGLTWFKGRSEQYSHILYDSVRGLGNTKALTSEGNNAEGVHSTLANITSFNDNGFTIGVPSSTDIINGDGNDFSSWTFRKAPGFFDVVTYDGDYVYGGATSQTINHNLGCVPGLILIKCTTTSHDWIVYHRSTGATKYFKFNNTGEATTSTSRFNDTEPTSTQFTVGSHGQVNVDGQSYVAYLFAGGESTASEAVSVDFDGSNDYMTIPTHADLAMGTGDLTMECWVLTDGSGAAKYIYDGRDGTSEDRVGIWLDDTNKIRVYADNTSRDSTTVLTKGQWYHVAWSRQGTTSRLFINGTQELSWSDSVDYAAPASNSYIGGISTGYNFDGKVSNFRIVKGTAVYTSSFKPPTEPLTNVTNTKLLCCNNSSVTGSTVSPTTIANSGSTASTDSPFDDPAGFKFGDSKEGIIKCGSYTTDSNEDATVNLGFEPQWVLIKRSDNGQYGADWLIYDSIRGLPNAQDIESATATSKSLSPNSNAVENNNHRIGITSTGFYADQYGANRTYIYMAIRRPDGYVGKLAEAGTDVFDMDTGAGSSTIPNFDSGFPVDFQLALNPAGTSEPRYVGTRLTLGKLMYLNTTDAESGASDHVYDSNVGWNKYSGWGSSYQSWMWKRHAGFDVVTYKGNGTAGHEIVHSLNKTPEMIWVKNRDRSEPWRVYHKGLNGGTTPHNYGLKLNTDDAESAVTIWNQTAPTSTHFTINADSSVNHTNEAIVALLFASVDGISKVGYFDGSDSEQTITTGFAPRFLIIKNVTVTEDWHVFDTTRGWASGNDTYLKLNKNDAQSTTYDFGAPTSTGFTLTGDNSAHNNAGQKFVYYAHA